MIAQSSTLVVYYGLRVVGWLRLNGDNRIELEYGDEWRAASDSFAISVSLPMDRSYRRGVADHRFFANLLPEADSREMICRSFGISSDNDFELLRRIGGVHLAPFYDLICTRAYPGLSRDLAMKVGGQADPGHLTRENWEQLARDVAVRPQRS